MSRRRLEQLLDAARVIILTPAIRDFLQRNDPKALAQLESAAGAAEEPARRRAANLSELGRHAGGRAAWLLDQVDQQRAWIQRCGGDLAGYVAHYGDPDLERCYGDGGTAIYKADVDELERLERAAGIRS